MSFCPLLSERDETFRRWKLVEQIMEYPETGGLKCYSSHPNVPTTDVVNSTLCFISIRHVTNEYSFSSYGYTKKCTNEECAIDKEAKLFCCSTDNCNTLSNMVLELSRSPSSKIWTKTVMPAGIMAVIALFPALSIFLILHPFWEKYRHQFPDALHIDATHIILDPIPVSSAELALSEPRATTPPDPSEGAVADITGVDVNVEAVITYSTNTSYTTREKDAGLICEMVTAESSTADILKAVLSFGPRELHWKSWLVVRILKEVQPILLEEETLVKCSLPVMMYGDLHGNYSDLWRWFNFNGWPQRTRSVFLGDYVDRGKHSMEVILLLFLLKIMYPRQLMLCRGNHEEDFVNRTYNFYGELKYRLRNDHYRSTFEKFAKTFRSMPLSCLVSGRILCLHGGLTPKITYLAEINQIQRPVPPTTRDSEHCGLLWSDPQRNRVDYKSNTHRDEPGGQGVGYLFGLGQIAKFVKENDLSLIVRGHQPPMAGYERIGPHLITLFSTAAYRTDRNGTPNMAASLFVDTDGTAVIRRFTVSEILKERRMTNKLDKGDEYSTRKSQKKKHRQRYEKYT